MKKGFTIVELLIVILIIGIFTGLSIPIFRSISSETLSSRAESFASVLKSARETAIVRNLECRIIFNPNSREYILQYGNEQPKHYSVDFRFSPGYATLAAPECGGGAPDPDGVQFPDNTLIIDSKGYATPGAVYVSQGRESYAIGIAVSGRIKVWKWGGGRWY
ncbi:MAG: GspH/FimT family protein [candidate division WOR-3 bacterium]